MSNLKIFMQHAHMHAGIYSSHVYACCRFIKAVTALLEFLGRYTTAKHLLNHTNYICVHLLYRCIAMQQLLWWN